MCLGEKLLIPWLPLQSRDSNHLPCLVTLHLRWLEFPADCLEGISLVGLESPSQIALSARTEKIKKENKHQHTARPAHKIHQCATTHALNFITPCRNTSRQELQNFRILTLLHELQKRTDNFSVGVESGLFNLIELLQFKYYKIGNICTCKYDQSSGAFFICRLLSDVNIVHVLL